MEKERLTKIANQFDFVGKVKDVSRLGEGFINDTFVVTIDKSDLRYILQRKNSNIFKNIPAMMDNIFKVTTHLKSKIIEIGGDPLRESLTVVLTKDGMLYYLEDNLLERNYWTATLFIEDTISYSSASTTYLAEQGGVGIGKFQYMMSDFNGDLEDTLPGFHNIKHRFKQWDETILRDPVFRVKEVSKEIEWVESRREKMLSFYSLIESGIIPTRFTHNDTKISNILFDKNDNVLCVIDLDTVLKAPALYDFGDAIRSYSNTGLEDDENLENVSMDINMYDAFKKGYLSQANSFLTEAEHRYLPFSPIYITFEQVLRFLMDYIDGDKYYKIKSPNHNLIRTYAQYRLLQSMETILQ